MVEYNPAIPIITLNVNCQNIPNKRDCHTGLKKNPTCCLQKTHFKYKDI